jgi:hypothetical protein
MEPKLVAVAACVLRVALSKEDMRDISWLMDSFWDRQS